MRRFAEEEVVIPDGRFAGRRFRVDRNPFAGLWFDAIDSGKWRRFAATGPRQSGKTLQAFVIPLLYHLFEMRETVILGVPSGDMVADKWSENILPAIQSSGYKDLLPLGGAGSRGGNVTSRVAFRNGATLRFMTGGGGDKSRAGFTSRVLVVTEADGMDAAGGGSREADKITQMEKCTASYGDMARVYLECTVSVEEGRIWQEYTQGTQSRIAVRCPHCRSFVTPEREHLAGWRDAADVMEAGEKTKLACPSCGAEWDESDRRDANADAMLVHRGQEMTAECAVTGPTPRTDTLGFRWTAANNLLVGMDVIGQEEWKGSRAADEENAEKSLRQFVWALPHEPAAVDLTQLDAHLIARRVTKDVRGHCPTGTRRLTVAIDLGKRLCHWIALAWAENATPHVVEYGRQEVASDEMGEERALLAALRDFRDSVLKTGWPCDGAQKQPDAVFVDAGWYQDVAIAFCQDSGIGYWPSKGVGEGQSHGRKQARDTGSKVVGVFEKYEAVRLPSGAVLLEINADHWKTWLHLRLQTPIGQPGAMTLYHATPADHIGISKHLTAEKKVEEFVAGRGSITRWEQVHRNNHWLDAAYLACTAGHAVGERLIGSTLQQETPAKAGDSRIPSSEFMNRGRNKW